MCSQVVDFEKTNIVTPGPHDVMLGRGGGTNNHVGNINFRKLVNEHKMRYIAASKVDKPKVAREVVAIWRNQTPVGRFLSKMTPTLQEKDVLWHDVGDQKAREKASQCLRERTTDVLPYIEQIRTHKVTADLHVSTPLQMHENFFHLHDRQQENLHRQELAIANRSHPTFQFVESNTIYHLQASNQNVGGMQFVQNEEPLQINATTLAVALLDEQNGKEIDPRVKDYLSRIATQCRNEDDSIDENASVTEIAKALFKNVKTNDGDEMSIDEFLKHVEGKDVDLQSLFDGTLSTWEPSLESEIEEKMSSQSFRQEKFFEDKNAFPPSDSGPPVSTKEDLRKSISTSTSGLLPISESSKLEADVKSSTSAYFDRTKKLKDAKRDSNVSMISELTDLTGDFSHMSMSTNRTK